MDDILSAKGEIMPRIHFTSGKVMDITEHEYDHIMPKMKNGGIRFYPTKRGDLIPLNSMTMEIITKGLEPAELDPEAKDPVEYKMPDSNETMKYNKKVPEKAEEDKEPKLTDQQKAEKAMADIIAKSNCTHPEETSQICVQETSKGPRYFPICTFCGFRGRYVKKDSLTDEQKTNAQVWAD